MVAAMNLAHWPLTDVVDDVYKVTTLCRVYATVVVPVDQTYLQVDGYTNLPPVCRQAG